MTHVTLSKMVGTKASTVLVTRETCTVTTGEISGGLMIGLPLEVDMHRHQLEIEHLVIIQTQGDIKVDLVTTVFVQSFNFN